MAVLTAQIRSTSSLWCCLALAVVAGCRNLDNAQVDVLERELRQQEDYIYELEDYLVEYSEKLRHARMVQCQAVSTTSTTSTTSKSGTSKTPKGQLREPTLDDDPVERPTLPLNGRNKPVPPSMDPAPASEAPAADASAAEPQQETAPEPLNPEEMEAPDLEIGSELGTAQRKNATAVAAAPTLPPESGAQAPLLIPDPVDYQADAEPSAVEPAASADAEAQTAETALNEPRLAAPELNAPRLSAERLQVRRIFSEPAEDGKSPGSLLVVVEALNATDEPVDAIGAASLMIMSRNAAGALRRLERWDFTAEETAAAWQSSQLGDGLHLELPLATGELPQGELELWARVADENGAKLLTPADDPYRFDSAQLISMADLPPDAVLTSTDAGEALPDTAKAAELTTVTENTAATKAPKPQWRSSAVRIDEDRVEGFATTATQKRGGWSTKPIDAAQPRVASASAKSASPTWKRSAKAAAVTNTGPAWLPDR